MKKSNRRGVLLLVVLSLLAMFAMVAVAFVVLTGVEKQSADRLKQIGNVDDAPDKTLQQAFNTIVRGTYINPSTLAPTTSAITWQSLLEKIYGYETIGSLNSPATMNSVTPVCKGQLIEFTPPTAPPDPSTYGSGQIDPFRCVGCVVTMLNGPAAGMSSRIVGVNPQNTNNVQMLAFEGGVQPAAGNQYIINGFPYSGMGFGFSNGGLTQTALAPNCPPKSWGATPNTAIIPGGVNSDYTAPDYQDLLLALAVPNPNNTGILVPIPSLHRSDLMAYWNKQQSGSLGNPTTLRQVMFRPNALDHPGFTGSNPNFNPLWDGITPGQGQWDVDNMGGGIPDSIWVNLGLPVRYTSDGRAYKPLFAILCLDMDGRLNLNAHGSYAQTQPAYYQQMIKSQPGINLQSYQYLNGPRGSGSNSTAAAPLDVGIGASQLSGTMATTVMNQSVFAGPATSGGYQVAPVPLVRGQGSGPAEVNLLPLFRNLAPGSGPANAYWNNYQYLLTGEVAPSGGTLMGRYGPPAPNGPVGSALPGINLQGSAFTLNRAFPYNGVMGGNYWTNFGLPSYNFDSHGSPPDHQTFGAVALSLAGRPLYISMGGPVANGPYDIDLTHNAPHAVDQATTADDPFGAAELERILRPFDRDANTLPQRLYTLTNTGSGSLLQSRRGEITTQSWSFPGASAVLPPALRAALPNKRSLHPVDILEAKIRQGGGSVANLKALRMQLLPWEILQGLKMDINRPFGSGAFTAQSNGTMITGFGRTTPAVPDQPGTTNEQVMQLVNGTGGPVKAQFNYVADSGDPGTSVSRVNGAAVTDSLAARQLYARHLYVLAMALADTGAMLTDLQKANPAANAEDVARLLAQWAVNVVAYRDHNNIMIPFPYDPNPFSGNGWGPDVSPATYNTPRYTVWGCKRPELLITETFAFHDRRTQDLDTETVNKKKPGRNPTDEPGKTTDTGKKKDPSFNSQFRPQGSWFVELYHPWTILEPRTPDLAPANGTPGVELTKLSPAVGGKQPSPVWRLVIVVPATIDKALSQNAPLYGDEVPDPDNPDVTRRPAIERVVYFVNMKGGVSKPGDGQVSYYPSAGSQIVIPPSGYAVIGSGDTTQQNRTYIGFLNGQTAGQATSTPMVTMNPTDLADARVVRNLGDPAPAATTSKPQVLAIDSPQRLSVSEPTIGYAQYEAADSTVGAQTPGANGQYKKPYDIPVDQQREIAQPDPNPNSHDQTLKIWSNYLNHDNTFASYRIVYLQRLADPTRPFMAESTAPGAPNPRDCNPYRTVDAMAVDLTCFNGVTSAKDPTTQSGATFYLEGHQRGENNYLLGTTMPAGQSQFEMNLWKQEPIDKTKLAAPGGWSAKKAGASGSLPKMNYSIASISQTLGYLNKPYWQPLNAPPSDPKFPFPWLNWSYRPFHNEYELLLVPAVSSSRLLARNLLDPRRYFGYVDGGVRTATNAGNYQPQAVYDPPTGSPSAQVPYPHLLNFFESTQSSKSGAGLGAQLHRLFAYVGVPSRFANVQLHIRPDLAGQSGAGISPHFFHTPFNRVSRYREPGRINLNTVTSPDVFLGAMNMYVPQLVQQQNLQLNPVFWDKIVRSRRGDRSGTPVTGASANPSQQTLNNMLQINPSAPSRFMNPYRTPGGAFLTAAAEPARETDVTLLRGDPDVLTRSGSTGRPLLEVDDYLMSTGNSGMNAPPDQFSMACTDFNRNPYFRYQAIQKLGSVVSNHSNVFAIWITVGYFQVSPAPNGVDAGHPDGFQLGAELGSDTGDVVRHRAFYMIDRSLPVGFIRGQDLNHQKAVLVNRFIE